MADRLRKCTVDGKAMYFHRWSDESWIVPPSPMVGGHNGGVVQGTYAIVEDVETGEISKALPGSVKFSKAEIIEARYGEWVYTGGRPIHCNQCGYAPEHPLTTDNSSFCPHCGADMRKEADNNG